MTDQSTSTMADLKKQRKAMARRRRRIIFNNDGDDLAMLGEDGMVDDLVARQRPQFPVTEEGLLAARTTALLGSHVDAIWYCTTHGLKIRHAPGPYSAFYGPSQQIRKEVQNLETLQAQCGKDTLEIMIDVCRQHGVEIFFSNRMNDTHDSFWPKLTRRIKIEHPEYTLMPAEEGRQFGWDKYPDVRTLWAALNFEFDEIRKMTVDALREVCQTYDIDGFELDFLRHPLYFKPTMQHEAVSAEHLDMMNGMVRDIRAMTEEEGLKRGRPILIAARCADDLALSRSIGLDVETWLKQDLVDVLVIGTWVDFTLPAKELNDLAHHYEVPAYSMVNPTYKAQDDWRLWRGDAQARFAEGADGVYMFNTFDPELKLWWELGDPAAMAGLDTTYTWDYLPSQRATSDVLAKVRLTQYRRPVTVTNKGCEVMPLFVGEDLTSAQHSGLERTLTLRVYVAGLDEGDKIIIKVNGQVLEAPQTTQIGEGDAKGMRLDFLVDGSLFKKGENAVEAALVDARPSSAQIDDVRLEVKYA